jgi:hypothetical protein
MIEACLIVAGSFRTTCQDALGLRAGATIAVLGGLCAEREGSMATTLDAETVAAIKDGLGGIEERLRSLAAQMRATATQEDLPEDEKDQLRGHLWDLEETDLVYAVLGLHKIIESQQHGRLYEMARMQTIGLMVAFARFAPEPFREAVERWDEDGEPDLRLIVGGVDDA